MPDLGAAKEEVGDTVSMSSNITGNAKISIRGGGAPRKDSISDQVKIRGGGGRPSVNATMD